MGGGLMVGTLWQGLGEGGHVTAVCYCQDRGRGGADVLWLKGDAQRDRNGAVIEIVHYTPLFLF